MEEKDFAFALRNIKQGKKLARQGWNGKGMFIYLVQGSVFEVNRKPLNEFYPQGTMIEYQAHIDMRTADGKCVPWLASQSDMLGNDWQIVE